MSKSKKSSIQFKGAFSGRNVLLCVGFVVVVSLYFTIDKLLDDTELFPVNDLELNSQFENIDRTTLIDVIAAETNRGFYRLDLDNIKLQLLTVPWVYNAAVTRRWPDKLSITVDEQQAVARWANGGLINIYGDIFHPSKASYPKNIPLIIGQSGEQKKLLLQYREMNKLLDMLNFRIAWLEKDKRHAIKLGLNHGTSLLLGRKNENIRLKRFVDVYKKLLDGENRAMYSVDLRYANGLAVQWATMKNKEVRDGV